MGDVERKGREAKEGGREGSGGRVLEQEGRESPIKIDPQTAAKKLIRVFCLCSR